MTGLRLCSVWAVGALGKKQHPGEFVIAMLRFEVLMHNEKGAKRCLKVSEILFFWGFSLILRPAAWR
jgi:hypothetical protein